MGFADRILARTTQRAWPVGNAELVGWGGPGGHDQSQFSPEEYGDYLATSNDIYTVVQFRARMLSRLRLRFYTGDDADKKEQKDSPAAKLFKYVNPHWTSKRLARMDELSLGLWGHSPWAIEYDRGEPHELWWMKPSRFAPVVNSQNYISDYAYTGVSGEVITFKPHEIIWQRYPNPLDEFAALAPLVAARLAADSAKAMQVANNQVFTNGLAIAGIVVPPGQDKVVFSDDQAKELEIALKRKFTGSKNAHKWAVLRHEARFLPMQMNQKDAEYLGGLNLTFRQVCRVYGIPAALLGDLEHATLANLRELQRGAWEQTLIPDADFRAEEFEEQYLTRFRGGPDHCEYDYSQIEALQESATESWTREAQALDRGAITINEWRQSKGKAAVEWGDKPYMPANKGPIDDDGVPKLPEPKDGKLPDDEANPANKASTPRFTHWQAREFLNAVKLNGALAR